MKRVTELPAFPDNSAGLQRGTILEATSPAVGQLGLSVGDKIPIGFDGDYVRCGPFTWDADQLCDEIYMGVWRIAGAVDLNGDELSARFAQDIERLEIVS